MRNPCVTPLTPVRTLAAGQRRRSVPKDPTQVPVGLWAGVADATRVEVTRKRATCHEQDKDQDDLLGEPAGGCRPTRDARGDGWARVRERQIRDGRPDVVGISCGRRGRLMWAMWVVATLAGASAIAPCQDIGEPSASGLPSAWPRCWALPHSSCAGRPRAAAARHRSNGHAQAASRHPRDPSQSASRIRPIHQLRKAGRQR